MNKKLVTENGTTIAIFHSDECLLPDAQAALDLIATLLYEDNCSHIAINKEAFSDDFFVLRTGMAGDILQKFINFSAKLAIIGDFSGYTSKPLHDLIYECNRGHSIFFVKDELQAIQRLLTA